MHKIGRYDELPTLGRWSEDWYGSGISVHTLRNLEYQKLA